MPTPDETNPVPDTTEFVAVAPPIDSAPPEDTLPGDAAPDDPPGGAPRHAARGSNATARTTGTGTTVSGINRGGWWAITLTAAVLLVIGMLISFGPARYWTPVPAVFLGYFVISGLIGLVFWRGVRELLETTPRLQSGDGPATPGARVAAAVGAVGIASALILLPMSLATGQANALPCPDGSNTCGPQPTIDPGPTQGNGGITTAPQAPTTLGQPPNDITGILTTPTQAGAPTLQGGARPMPTPDPVDPNACLLNCGPTPAPQAGQPGQANAPRTGQNPVTTPPRVQTTPPAPTTTPQPRTPTPETTTSSKTRERDNDAQRSSDEDRDKNSGIPYQAAEIAALAGTYRRKKTADRIHDGRVAGATPGRVVAKQISDHPVGDTYGREPYPAGPEKELAASNAAFGTKRETGDKPLATMARQLAVELNAGLMTGYMTPALQGLKHYLTPNSGDFIIWAKDMDKIIQGAAYQKQIHQQLLGPMAYSIAQEGGLKPGQSVTKYFKTPWEVSDGRGLSDGYYNLLGNYSHMAMGKMTVTATANGYSYDASYAVSIYDFYDFNPRLAPPSVVGMQGITNADLVAMVDAGYAQSFRTVGTSSVHALSGSVGTIGVPL